LAYSGGGLDSPENFLLAHRLCNKYRWDYLSEEFQWILKMGVWSRTLIQNSSPGDGLGRKMAERFFKYEQHNEQRRENQNKKSGNLFRVSAGLRREVLRKKVRESSQRFGAKQARSGPQAEPVEKSARCCDRM
jgi:hypothetical protein